MSHPMSIDRGKLLALASEIQSAVGHAIEPDVQHVPVTWLLDWAERLRALAQPAEAVEGEACDACDAGWQWFEGYGREHRVKCEACGGTGKKPAEAVEGSGSVAALVAAANAVLAENPNDDTMWSLEAAVAPFNARKPAECADGCPPKQVCDYCQVAATDAAQGAVATVCLVGERYAHGHMVSVELQLASEDAPAPKIGDRYYTHPQAAPAQGDGVGLIAAERRRQVEAEGWTPEHDDVHTDGSLAVAAACYATQANQGLYENGNKARDAMLRYWPWDRAWWKPTPENRLRELVKAGALIAAEIDRLQRAAAHSPEPQ